MCKTIPMLAFVLSTLLGAASLLGACNTMAGAGQDISNVGNAIERSADKHAP